MAVGKISRDGKIELPMEVLGDDESPISSNAVLDTGFNGFLTLPSGVLESINALTVGSRVAVLGDGSRVQMDVYRIRVNWLGQPRVALVLHSESEPLLGMSLVWGNRVCFDAVDDGEVSIQSLN